MDLYKRQQRREEGREGGRERLNKGRQEQQQGGGGVGSPVESNLFGLFHRAGFAANCFPEQNKQVERENQRQTGCETEREDGQMRSGESGVFLPW